MADTTSMFVIRRLHPNGNYYYIQEPFQEDPEYTANLSEAALFKQQNPDDDFWDILMCLVPLEGPLAAGLEALPYGEAAQRTQGA